MLQGAEFSASTWPICMAQSPSVGADTSAAFILLCTLYFFLNFASGFFALTCFKSQHEYSTSTVLELLESGHWPVLAHM